MSKSSDVFYKKIKKLEPSFKAMSNDKMTIGLSLIKEAYFIGETLSRLKTQLQDSDIVESFEQGSQKFLRENPALKSYNTTLKNYQNIMKQLTDMLPDNPHKNGEGLSKYLASDSDN